MNPETTPQGLDFPPPTPPARITGSRGRIQGERMVTTPAKKAKIIKMVMVTAPYLQANLFQNIRYGGSANPQIFFHSLGVQFYKAVLGSDPEFGFKLCFLVIINED